MVRAHPKAKIMKQLPEEVEYAMCLEKLETYKASGARQRAIQPHQQECDELKANAEQARVDHVYKIETAKKAEKTGINQLMAAIRRKKAEVERNTAAGEGQHRHVEVAEHLRLAEP